MRFSIVFDENTAMTNLIAGRFHKYYPVVPDNVGRAEKESGGKMKEISVRSPGRRLLLFNATKQPFSDIRLRQAVSLVLDRNEGVLLNVLKPKPGVAPGGYIVPGDPWTNSTDQMCKVPGYDRPDVTAERKRLVQQLQLKYLNNFPVSTMYFVNSNHAIWTTVQNYKVPTALYVNNRYQDVWLNKA